MESCFMCKKCFDEATKASNEILSLIDDSKEGPISIEKLLNAVSKYTNTDILFGYLNFSDNHLDSKYGAMMCVIKDEKTDKYRATIILNSDHEKEYQRFSLVHELGHLVTKCHTVEEDNNNYTLSAHINYNINCISEDDCKQNRYLLCEQIANVFALRVLMPSTRFKDVLYSMHDINDIAKEFGVTANAVKERALLGI